MAQRFKSTLAVPPKVLSSILSKHMVVHNHLRDLVSSSGTQMYMQAECCINKSLKTAFLGHKT